MNATTRNLAAALVAAWEGTPAREIVRLAATGLNFVTMRELFAGLTATDLSAVLVAALWLIPWERLALVVYRAVRRSPERTPSRTGATVHVIRATVHVIRASVRPRLARWVSDTVEPHQHGPPLVPVGMNRLIGASG